MEAKKLAPKPRSLAPKEHGAYGQFFLPLLAALLSSRPHVTALALAVASSAVFFAHEPLLLLLGQRGARAKAEAGNRARRRLLWLGLLALGGGTLASVTAQPPVLSFMALSGVLGAIVWLLAWKKWEKTLGGELVVVTAMASVAVPVALAGGLSLPKALAEWAVWTVTFSTVTFAVHSVIARTRKEPWRLLEGATVAVGIAPLLGALLTPAPAILALALLPPALMAVALTILRPHARALRSVGWGTASLCSLTLLVLTLGY